MTSQLEEAFPLITDEKLVFAMLAKLSSDIRKLIIVSNEGGIDVDEWLSSQSVPQSVYTLKPVFEAPVVVDFILAVFPVGSTSVLIQLGTRFIPVQNIAAGIFAVDLRMQLEYEDIRQMTITPAGVGHFEIMGHPAQRVQDRP
jgi:hypothetical protein